MAQMLTFSRSSLALGAGSARRRRLAGLLGLMLQAEGMLRQLPSLDDARHEEWRQRIRAVLARVELSADGFEQLEPDLSSRLDRLHSLAARAGLRGQL